MRICFVYQFSNFFCLFSKEVREQAFKLNKFPNKIYHVSNSTTRINNNSFNIIFSIKFYKIGKIIFFSIFLLMMFCKISESDFIDFKFFSLS